MWDTVLNSKEHLSHDMPCFKCGHAWHTYLPCSDECDCSPDLHSSTVAEESQS
jgi:hypothetical protein